jgi:predicted ArsR family transcriptional regulator
MGKTKTRTQVRREKLLEVLPHDLGKGKTYVEVASLVSYSTATIRTDLEALKAKGLVECDDSRRPFKWYRAQGE